MSFPAMPLHRVDPSLAVDDVISKIANDSVDPRIAYQGDEH